MDTHKQYVIVAEDKLDGLLHTAVDLYLLQPSETADAMVGMNYVIPGIEIGELPDGHAVTPGEEPLDAELMIAVKYLMISVYCDSKIVIGETLVKVEEQGSKLC